MNTDLYWFSGTGNTLWAARALAEQLGQTRLVPIASPAAWNAPPAERGGIAFPVYAWGPPAIVTRFLDQVQLAPGGYLFVLTTAGGDPGSAARVAQRRLAKRGVELASAFSIRLPDNYPPLGGAPALPKQQKMFIQSVEQVKRAAQQIQAGVRGHVEVGSMLFRALGRIINPGFIKRAATMDKSFVTDDMCNGCGLCASLCPVDNIKMSEQSAGLCRPRWLGHCEQCFACFHWCPQAAIQFGKRSAKQGRYHHPQVEVSDMMPTREGQ